MQGAIHAPVDPADPPVHSPPAVPAPRPSLAYALGMYVRPVRLVLVRHARPTSYSVPDPPLRPEACAAARAAGAQPAIAAAIAQADAMFVSPLLRALQTAVCITAGRRRVHVQQAPALWIGTSSTVAAGDAAEALSSTDEENAEADDPALSVFVCPWLRELRGTPGDTVAGMPARSALPLPLWTAVRWLPAGWCVQDGGQSSGQVNVRLVRQAWRAGEEQRGSAGVAASGACSSSAAPTDRETRASLRHRIGAVRAAVRLYAEQHGWQLVVLVCHAHVMREFGMPASPGFLQSYETWL